MSSWRLNSGVYAAWAGADLVLLDLGSDGYLCLPGPLDLRLQAGQLSGDRAVAEVLQEAGLAHAEPVVDAPPPRAALPGRPLRELDVDPGVRLRTGEVIDLLACWLECAVLYPRRSIAALGRQVRHRPGSTTPSSSAELARRVALFRAVLPWLPWPGACLFRAFFLLSWLRRGGCAALWVFGVRTWPFEAHCWLQIEDVALDDHVDRLRRFHPILAI